MGGDRRYLIRLVLKGDLVTWSGAHQVSPGPPNSKFDLLLIDFQSIWVGFCAVQVSQIKIRFD